MPKGKIPCKRLSIIELDSANKAEIKYYNKYYIYIYIYIYIPKKFITKKIYKTPLLSIKLEQFIMLIASSLFMYQKNEFRKHFL